VSSAKSAAAGPVVVVKTVVVLPSTTVSGVVVVDSLLVTVVFNVALATDRADTLKAFASGSPGTTASTAFVKNPETDSLSLTSTKVEGGSTPVGSPEYGHV